MRQNPNKASPPAGAKAFSSAEKRRGQPIRSRAVSGRSADAILRDLRSEFEKVFADRRGQARGAAMRGPNRLLREMEEHTTALRRQTQRREAQLVKLTNEVISMRHKPAASTKAETMAPDRAPPSRRGRARGQREATGILPIPMNHDNGSVATS